MPDPTPPTASLGGTRRSGKGTTHGELRLPRGDQRLGVRWKRRRPRAAEKGYRVAVIESGRRWNDEDIPKTEVINRNASAHFVGGIPIGEDAESGAVDPHLRLFGQPGMHVMDGSVMPANPEVNPSLMITPLAEIGGDHFFLRGVEPELGRGARGLDGALRHDRRDALVARVIGISSVND